MKETESLLIAAFNNAIRSNHIKAKIDKTQQNSRCRLCGKRDEIINVILSECSKLAQKDKVGKVIHLELCKMLKFDHTNKCYMYNPKSVQDNETHRLLRNFKIQTNHQISTGWQDLRIIKKKKQKKLTELCCLGGPQIEIKRMWKEG